jgi:ATP-dependent 26S proteasome regulatory subunit
VHQTAPAFSALQTALTALEKAREEAAGGEAEASNDAPGTIESSSGADLRDSRVDRGVSQSNLLAGQSLGSLRLASAAARTGAEDPIDLRLTLPTLQAAVQDTPSVGGLMHEANETELLTVEAVRKAWAGHIHEAPMSSSFETISYPLQPDLLNMLKGHTALALGRGPAAVAKIGANLIRVKRAVRLSGEEGTELLQEAIVTALAASVQGRIIVLDAAVLDSIKEVSLTFSTGKCLSVLFELLASAEKSPLQLPDASTSSDTIRAAAVGSPAIVLVRDNAECIMRSDSACSTLLAELEKEAANPPNFFVVISAAGEGVKGEFDHETLERNGERNRAARESAGREEALPELPLQDELSDALQSMLKRSPELAFDLRRCVQLANAEAAEAGRKFKPSATLEEERAYALNHVLPKMKRVPGFPDLTGPLTKLFEGVRDETTILAAISSGEPSASDAQALARCLLSAVAELDAVASTPAHPCPSGHGPLRRFFTPNRYKCDICQKGIPACSVMYGCRSCPGGGYDECISCYDKHAIADASAAAVPLSRTPSTMPQASKTGKVNARIETLQIKPPSDPGQLAVWKKHVRRDLQCRKLNGNIERLERVLNDMRLSCSSLRSKALEDRIEISADLSQSSVSIGKMKEVVSEAVQHAVGVDGLSSVGDSVELPVASLLYAFASVCKLTPAGMKNNRPSQAIDSLAENEHEKNLVGLILGPEQISVKWEAIGGLEATKQLLRQFTVYPLKYPELYSALKTVKGVLLFGPPGTGKSMLAKAIATESDANFMKVDAASINDKYHGESEKNALAIFTLARKISPTVIFIDEIDSIVATRKDGEKQHETSLKTTIFAQMDGVDSQNAGLIVIGATNRPWDLDEAALRRLPRRILVDLPSEPERHAILSVCLGAPVKLAADVDLKAIAAKLDGYSGSDLRELCSFAASIPRNAKAKELSEAGATSVGVVAEIPVTAAHLAEAQLSIKRSVEVDSETRKQHIEWNAKYGENKSSERHDERPDFMYM